MRHLQGRSEAALVLIRRAAEGLPGEPGPLNNLGNVLMALQRHDEAEAAYRRCLALQPGFVDAIGNLASLCARRGALDEAARRYRQALARDPGNPLFVHHLAACLDEPPPERASDAYLQRVFDHAAAGFDLRLGDLGYQAPERAEQLLRAHLPAPAAQFESATSAAAPDCAARCCAPGPCTWPAATCRPAC